MAENQNNKTAFTNRNNNQNAAQTNLNQTNNEFAEEVTTNTAAANQTQQKRNTAAETNR